MERSELHPVRCGRGAARYAQVRGARAPRPERGVPLISIALLLLRKELHWHAAEMGTGEGEGDGERWQRGGVLERGERNVRGCLPVQPVVAL